jgi:uncharacterized membrane protein YeaQ/YmgE (transglycosylase-associated protein family)
MSGGGCGIHPAELLPSDNGSVCQYNSRGVRLVNFDVIALIVLCLIWAAFGVTPWLVVAYRRKGRGTLALLPLAIVGGVAGAALVPALGARNLPAVLGSLVAAMAGSLILTLAALRLPRLLSRTARSSK